MRLFISYRQRLFYSLLLSCTVGVSGCGKKHEAKKEPPPPPIFPRIPCKSQVAPEDVAAAPKDAKHNKSGLVTKLFREGTGKEHPAPDDTVRVNYSGWLPDGTLFETTATYGKPMEIVLSRTIPGWIEGVGEMVAGECRRLWVPAALGYKNQDSGKHDVVFEVELVSVDKHAPTLPLPKEAKKPPKDALKTKDEWPYVVLKPGSGKGQPRPENSVVINYSIWRHDGSLMHSSELKKIPEMFIASGPVWLKGIFDMTTGEQRRFWIPSKAIDPSGPENAYDVYEITLLEVKP